MKLLKKIADAPHRAWRNDEPTEYDILELLRRTKEQTTVVTCTRRGAALVNDLSVSVLFEHKHKEELAQLPFDYDANMENFGEGGKLIPGQQPQPLMANISKEP